MIEDLRTGRFRKTKLRWGFANVNDRWLVVPALEFDTGIDLNLDGDRADHVLQAVCLETGEQINLGLSSWEGDLSNDVVICAVYEDQMRQDLNDDGDTEDFVHHAYDLETRSVENLRITADTRADSHALTDSWFVASILERNQGRDLSTISAETDARATMIEATRR